MHIVDVPFSRKLKCSVVVCTSKAYIFFVSVPTVSDLLAMVSNHTLKDEGSLRAKVRRDPEGGLELMWYD